jgi:hypothetical protein
LAHVHDDQVEEVRRELAEELLALVRSCDRLVEPEVDLEGGVDAPVLVERERDLAGRAVGAFDRPRYLGRRQR